MSSIYELPAEQKEPPNVTWKSLHFEDVFYNTS
jgi:hypothetical protein